MRTLLPIIHLSPSPSLRTNSLRLSTLLLAGLPVCDHLRLIFPNQLVTDLPSSTYSLAFRRPFRLLLESLRLILVAKVRPMPIRPYGIALGASFKWMVNFIVGKVTLDMLSGITYGSYIIFGPFCLISAAFIWFSVPETERLTLEEMDILFGPIRWLGLTLIEWRLSTGGLV